MDRYDAFRLAENLRLRKIYFFKKVATNARIHRHHERFFHEYVDEMMNAWNAIPGRKPYFKRHSLAMTDLEHVARCPHMVTYPNREGIRFLFAITRLPVPVS